MARIARFEIDGNEIEFINIADPTRHGFKHHSSLFVNGFKESEATCHYLNRTWEWYTFQTSMLSAVDNALKEAKDNIRARFLRENGISRISGEKRKAAFAAQIAENPEIKFFSAIADHLKAHIVC